MEFVWRNTLCKKRIKPNKKQRVQLQVQYACVCDWYSYWDFWWGWRTKTNGMSCNYVPVLSWCSFDLHYSPSVTAVFLLVALELKISLPYPILSYLSNPQHPSEFTGVAKYQEFYLFLDNYGELNKIRKEEAASEVVVI